MGIFDFFKNKKKELATSLYGVFKPKIEVVKKFGKWEKNKSVGQKFIENEYLIGFLNMYINLGAQANGVKGAEQGRLAAKVYELMDPTFKEFNKLKALMDRYHELSSKGSKEFKLATDEAFMFYHTVTNHPAINEFSKNKVFKEAQKYINSGKAQQDHEFATKMMPKDLYDEKFMESVPENVLIAYRLFEITFEKKLNKFFKIK